MGEWSSTDMRAEVVKPDARFFPVLTVALKDSSGVSTSYRFSSAGSLPVGSTCADPRVERWGGVRMGFDLLAPSLGRSETSITLTDTDGRVRSLLEAGNNRKAAASVHWVLPDVSVEEPRFSGIVDSWSYGDHRTTLSLRTDDRPLETNLPRLSLLKSDWPALTGTMAQNYGIYFPIVMGSHSSSGITGTGMVKAYAVEWTASTTGWYTPCLGPAQSIGNVFVAGVAKTLTTHYTLETTARGGKTLQLIKFATGNIPTESQSVTVDIVGAEDAGDGTGAAILNPVRQLRHLLLSFVLGDWRTGAYPSASESTTSLDDALWSDAADIADLMKFEGSLHVGGDTSQRRARDIVEDWCQSWPMFRLYWTRAGRLGIRHITLKHPGYRSELEAAYLAGTYRHETAVVRPYHELQPTECALDASEIADRVSASFLPSQATGSKHGQVEVYDPDAGEDVRVSYDMPCSVARAV